MVLGHPTSTLHLRAQTGFLSLNHPSTRLVCIGAGYAGLMMAYKIKHQMKMEDVVDLCIYEKNHDVGGTWLENRYPGVAW
jgi:cation diffusion facilitator CzcD-associated flavoprotein CzcO